MVTPRYRAILVDPGNSNQERPVQVLGNDMTELKRWAGEVLKKAVAESAQVDIYETSESKVDIVLKPLSKEPA